MIEFDTSTKNFTGILDYAWIFLLESREKEKLNKF